MVSVSPDFLKNNQVNLAKGPLSFKVTVETHLKIIQKTTLYTLTTAHHPPQSSMKWAAFSVPIVMFFGWTLALPLPGKRRILHKNGDNQFSHCESATTDTGVVLVSPLNGESGYEEDLDALR